MITLKLHNTHTYKKFFLHNYYFDVLPMHSHHPITQQLYQMFFKNLSYKNNHSFALDKTSFLEQYLYVEVHANISHDIKQMEAKTKKVPERGRPMGLLEKMEERKWRKPKNSCKPPWHRTLQPSCFEIRSENALEVVIFPLQLLPPG